ncbi:MAG: hypothetical protein OEN50_01120 [Deltaproteobacteria bacterium]|nr:hypothetical protein [Deltaproteobacteria bacterium]
MNISDETLKILHDGLVVERLKEVVAGEIAQAHNMEIPSHTPSIIQTPVTLTAQDRIAAKTPRRAKDRLSVTHKACYLPDWRLDINAVLHKTPGLCALASSRLATLLHNQFVDWNGNDDTNSNEVDDGLALPIDALAKHARDLELTALRLDDAGLSPWTQAIRAQADGFRTLILTGLVKRLGSNDWATRDAADTKLRRLIELDPYFRGVLDPYRSDADPEIRTRVRKIMADTMIVF